MAKNDEGVLVNISLGKDHAAYEVGGICYSVPKERTYDGLEYTMVIYPSCARRENEYHAKLPTKLIDRIRKEMPQAFQALGVKCIVR